MHWLGNTHVTKLSPDKIYPGAEIHVQIQTLSFGLFYITRNVLILVDFHDLVKSRLSGMGSILRPSHTQGWHA